jgi:hypothetical protein
MAWLTRQYSKDRSSNTKLVHFDLNLKFRSRSRSKTVNCTGIPDVLRRQVNKFNSPKHPSCSNRESGSSRTPRRTQSIVPELLKVSLAFRSPPLTSRSLVFIFFTFVAVHELEVEARFDKHIRTSTSDWLLGRTAIGGVGGGTTQSGGKRSINGSQPVSVSLRCTHSALAIV